MGKRGCCTIILKARLISALLAASTLYRDKKSVILRKRLPLLVVALPKELPAFRAFESRGQAQRSLSYLPSIRPPTIMALASSGGTDAASSQSSDYVHVQDIFGRKALESYKTNDQESAEWIRIENELDPCFADISCSNDILQKMEEVRLNQSRFGCSDLYPRAWNATGPLETDDTSGAMTFSVAQFNALAEGLSIGQEDPKPFAVDRSSPTCQLSAEEEGYGGFSSVPHPSETLDFSKRRWRLLEVILGGGIHRPSTFDLIGLQEIDRFHGFFAPALQMFGYKGIFMPKKFSPCVRAGSYSDGCCLFWKTDKFDLVAKRRIDYRVGNQLCLLTTLRHRASGKIILVAVTHLKAKNSENNENTRKQQVAQLLISIDKEVGKLKATAVDDSKENVPILILGDFNADPPSQPMGRTVMSSVGQVLEHSIGGCPNPAPVRQQNRKCGFQSAYDISDPSTDLWTTRKIRGTETTKRIIDFIFYAGSLKCTAVLDVPSSDLVEPSKLPGLRYPSDHLLVAAGFRFV